MQAAMCSIAWKPEPIEAVAPLVAAAGYSGIELWGPHLDRFVAAAGSLDPLVAQLRTLGLTVPMVSAYFDLLNQPEESIAIASRHLHYALRLGAPLVRMFTGGGGSATASEAAWATITDVLGELCDLARPYGIAFALETHDGHLHDTTPSTLRLIHAVNAPNLGVNLDIHNLYARGEEPLWSLEQLWPWVRILHLKSQRLVNGAPQVCGLAEGNLDYTAFLQALAVRGYGGAVSIEWFGSAPTQAAASELAFLRNVLGYTLTA
jgi:sugar phosphate isomerase/epimerase